MKYAMVDVTFFILSLCLVMLRYNLEKLRKLLEILSRHEIFPKKENFYIVINMALHYYYIINIHL